MRVYDGSSMAYEVPAAGVRYGNIIYKERPVHNGDLFSRRHPRMSQLNRAKIFAPFAALVGFEEAVRSKEIQYIPKHILDAEEIYELNTVLNLLHHATRNGNQARSNQIAVCVRYFVVCSDANNDAYGRLGVYHTQTGIVWKIDPVLRMVHIGSSRIPIADIAAITDPTGERFPIPKPADHK